MMVEELLSYTPSDIDELNNLMHELSPTSFCDDEILKNVLSDVNSHAYVIRDEGQIIAAGTLCVMHNLEFTIASIESVVVSSKYRGYGYGRELIQHMINEAKRIKVHSIHLTSNPKRETANLLYQNMHFELYDTNCYRLYL